MLPEPAVITEPQPVSQPLDQAIQRNFRFNFTINVIDGIFFGLAMGLVSYTTVLPLFVRQLSGSALLIGLLTATHFVGWQFPQLFTARLISRQRRYLPLALLMTTQERLPYLILAAVTWFSPRLGASTTLAVAFFLLLWQGIGGGLTANPWQNLIAKVITPRRVGLFYGLQAALFSSFFALGAVLSGLLLERLPFPDNFTLCFLFAGLALLISMGCLALTREPAHELPAQVIPAQEYWRIVLRILREDRNFLSFALVRSLFQFATMAFTFYVVYGVERFGMSKLLAGQIAGAVSILTMAANPILGWLGDRFGHRQVITAGALASALSAGLAVLAPSLGWMMPVFVLTAIPGVVSYTSIMSMTLGFGSQAERPIYIGLAHTLVAPATILAPMLGGWLADHSGYPSAFALSAAFGLAAAACSVYIKNPHQTFNPVKEVI